MARVSLGCGIEAIVDDDSLGKLVPYVWRAVKSHCGLYAMGALRHDTKHSKMISMHRLIISPTVGVEVDHINGDTLDNRLDNLREATKSQNRHNQFRKKKNLSGYQGITYVRNTNRYHGRVMKDRKVYATKIFKTAEEALIAHMELSISLFGEFSPYLSRSRLSDDAIPSHATP